MLSSGCEGDQVSFLMDVEETWKHVLHNWVFACQILKIIGSQIEIERIFSLARVFTNLKRCHLQSEYVENFVFEQKLAQWM